MLYEEYNKIIQSVHNLNIQEFFVFQNQLESLCFGERSSQKLTNAFEKLSGSS